MSCPKREVEYRGLSMAICTCTYASNRILHAPYNIQHTRIKINKITSDNKGCNKANLGTFRCLEP